MAIKLKDIKLFEGIDSDYIKMIVDNSRRVNYSIWDIILNQWDESNGCAYIIQEWVVRVEINWSEVAKIWEGSIFWEIALITNETRVASVIAETNLVLLKIDQELLHTIIKKFKNWKQIQEVLMKRILENAKNSK
jgi:CRP-like cAMP-binding protein